jgi:hypothetical protein
MLILPALFPSLLTGWITAMGGAWNASIVAEYVHYRGETLILETELTCDGGVVRLVEFMVQASVYHSCARSSYRAYTIYGKALPEIQEAGANKNSTYHSQCTIPGMDGLG